MANNKKENKIEKFTKEAIGKTLNQFNKEIGIADLVEINKNQDRILNGILSQVNDESTEKTEKSNIITLDNSTDGIVELKEIQGDTNVNVSKIEEDMPITNDIGEKEGNIFNLNEVPKGAISIGEIQGNTMVNCNKDDKKELVLMKDLSTQGDNSIDITEGVGGGLVDVALEGNTLVNVSHTKDSTAISKAYTVENSGNHIALQGDVDGNCRPVIEGNTLVNLLDLNFIDKEPTSSNPSYISSANKEIGWDWSIGQKYNNWIQINNKLNIAQPNKTYTLIANIKQNNPMLDEELLNLTTFGQAWIPNCGVIQVNIPQAKTGIFKWVFTTTEDTSRKMNEVGWYVNSKDSAGNALINGGKLIIGDIMLLEGDYSDKPIPDYFTGLQSTFEDNLVAQEMVDSGEEVVDNLGKYKVNYKVTGKNLFNKNKGLTDDVYTHYIPCQPNTSYTTSDGNTIWFYDKDKKNLGYTINSKPSPSNARYLRKRLGDTTDEAIAKVNTLQIEEGSTETTSYEPYKEYTKTLYLNSPLLEGNTIEEKDGSVYHVHRYTKVVLDGVNNSGMSKERNAEFNDDNTMLKVSYTREDIKSMETTTEYDGSLCDKLYWKADIPAKASDTPCYGRSKQNWKLMINIPLTNNTEEAINTYLQSNPLTFVLPLETPRYELIEQSNLVIPSYANGHLDFNTTVPVEKVDFLPFSEELTYLYANTQYTVQFISDKAITVDITLGGTQLLAQSIVAGLNRISITTPATLVDNKLIISGVGAKISEVVVTDTDREFKYFEGMTSVGEQEGNKIEILSNNKNLYDLKTVNQDWSVGTIDVIISPNNLNYHSCEPFDISFFRGKTLYSGIFRDGVLRKSIVGFGVIFDENRKIIGNRFDITSQGYLVPNNAKYMRLMFGCGGNSLSWIDRDKYAVSLEPFTSGETLVEHQSNTQQLTHEPLRAVGDVKDRYVLIDGKWYIERRCREYTIPQDTIWTKTAMVSNNGKYTRYYFIMDNMITDQLNASNYVNFAISELLPFGYSNSWTTCNRNEIQIINNSTELYVQLDKTTIEEVASLMNGSKIIYRLKTPVYEEIDYNPFEVYPDVTHITTNSAIPTNIIIKNHGFNCLLKPSTTYTVSSNLGLNTVTTGADIGDSCLRFYDEDTSDITTMKDVLVLEGDWTAKADLIPSNFSGIESAFEQELVTDENDVNYGKYKVTAKVVGKNVFDKNIELLDGYYINNTDGSNTRLDGYCVSKDYIRIQPNTTYYGTNMNHIGLYDKDKNYIRRHALWNTEKTFTTASNAYYIRYQFSSNDDLNIVQLEQGDTASAYEPYKENNITFYINEPLRGIGDVKDRVFVKDDKVVVQRNCAEFIINETNPYSISENNPGYPSVLRIWLNQANIPNYKQGTVLCDTLPYYGNMVSDTTGIGLGNGLDIHLPLPTTSTLNEAREYLKNNPLKIVYQLAEPTYEEVEYSSNRLILDTFNNESFNNSTLFLDTNISPKLSFKPLWEELVYVKSNTKYYIQFNAVSGGEVVINLGGTELTTEIVEGYNCIPITTPSESTNLMTISGQGITISEVVVSEVICGGYYKGLQSCFEEHMENGKYRILLRGIALDGSKVNGIKLYINEPLRGIGEVKDRLCIKNGKLMVERKCGEIVFDGSDDEGWDILSLNFVNHTKAITKSIPNLKGTDNYRLANSYCDKFIQLAESPNFRNDTQEYYAISASKIEISINNSKLSSPDVNGIKKWLQQNPTKITYELKNPTYEEATNKYGLPIVFEGYENGIVYIDSAVTPTTHIKYTSNNQLATTLSEAEEQNIATQEDINMNVITYMMDIDMMLTDMEMSNDTSVMAVRRDSSNENMLDRMSDEDKKVYRDNTVVMLEKMITAKVLDKEDIEGRIDMYYNKNRISKEQYKYLKSLL